MYKWKKNYIAVILSFSVFFTSINLSIMYVQAQEMAASADSSTVVVFVDGIDGNDDNVGSVENPYKTMARAYNELQNTGGIITICNTVTIEEEIVMSAEYWSDGKEKITLGEGKSITIARYENNANTLFDITAESTTLTDSIIIDGSNVAKSLYLFKIGSEASLNIENAILKNNTSSSINYSAVLNEGTLTMSGGTVESNSKSIINRGTFHMMGGMVTSNTYGISNENVFNMSGGTISLTGDDAVGNTGTFTMTGGIITQNSGNAIDNYNAEFTMKAGQISYNSNTAIYNRNNSTMIMYGGTIENNTSPNEGGAISNYSSNLTIEDGIFTNNTAESGGAIDSYDYAGGHRFIMNGGTISGNKAASAGGGINCTSGSEKTTVILSNVNVVDNNAKSGGGLYMGSYVNLTMQSCNILRNAAESYGGGLYNTASANLTDCCISDNTANTAGGIYTKKAINISDSSIISNIATTYGGGIYTYGGDIILTNSNIANNEGSYGGGIYNYRYGAADIIINSGSISDNRASYDGGGIYHGSGTLQIDGGRINENSAASGGGVYIYSNTVVDMNGGEVLGNTASNFGNGIYQNGTLKMSGSAVISLDNDVYLCNGKFITVDKQLSSDGIAAVVTPNNYYCGRTCVQASYGTAVASDIVGKFDLTPKDVYCLRAGDWLTESANISDINVIISEGYAVSYDANGGIDAPDSQTKYWYENLTLQSGEPKREGYAFEEWNTAEDGTEVVFMPADIYVDNEPLVLYAQWLDENRSVTAIKRLKAEEINFSNGTPVAIFKLNSDNRIYYKTVEFTEAYVGENTDEDGYVSMTVVFDELDSGKYVLSEVGNFRYDTESITGVENGEVNGKSVKFEINERIRSCQAVFTNGVSESRWFGDNDIIINTL